AKSASTRRMRPALITTEISKFQASPFTPAVVNPVTIRATIQLVHSRTCCGWSPPNPMVSKGRATMASNAALCIEEPIPRGRPLEEPIPLSRKIPDQRTSARFVIAVEVSVASEANFFAGLTGDISAGGIFVPTYETYPVGSLVDVELTLPTLVIRVTGT